MPQKRASTTRPKPIFGKCSANPRKGFSKSLEGFQQILGSVKACSVKTESAVVVEETELEQRVVEEVEVTVKLLR